MDISGSNERPTHIGFEIQEGDWGLQKGYWAPGWDGGAVDILLRGSIGLSGILQMDDEKYFAALIRMYGRSLEIVSSLPPAERSTYLERLGRLRSRGRNVGWVVEEEFNSVWYDAVDEQQSE